jgi:hypothetical protein
MKVPLSLAFVIGDDSPTALCVWELRVGIANIKPLFFANPPTRELANSTTDSNASTYACQPQTSIKSMPLNNLTLHPITPLWGTIAIDRFEAANAEPKPAGPRVNNRPESWNESPESLEQSTRNLLTGRTLKITPLF